MDYLSLLKEAAKPKTNKIVKETQPSKLNQKLLDDFKGLWIEMIKDDNKHSKKYKDNPVKPNEHYFNWIRKQQMLVYIEGNSLLGFMVLERDKKLNRLYIDTFIVDPKYRGRGIGTALMQRAFQTAKKEGFNKVDLDVWESNKKAQALYSKHGFKTIGRQMRKFV